MAYVRCLSPRTDLWNVGAADTTGEVSAQTDDTVSIGFQLCNYGIALKRRMTAVAIVTEADLTA